MVRNIRKPIDAISPGLDIETLPEILNFREEEVPLLHETHRRIIEVAKTQGLDQAEAATETYHDLAEAHLQNKLLTNSESVPQSVLENIQAKARCGMLIKIANIWHEAGIISQCVEALDRAISYSKNMRWKSISTALELEKQKLQGANT